MRIIRPAKRVTLLIISVIIFQIALVVWLFYSSVPLKDAMENILLTIFNGINGSARSTVIKGTGNQILDFANSQGRHQNRKTGKSPLQTGIQKGTFHTQWHLLKDKLQRLNEHPLFGSFDIKAKANKPFFPVVLIVSSVNHRFDRRKAIRSTWWTSCLSSDKTKIKCVFMTDLVNASESGIASIKSETQYYDDIEIMPFKRENIASHALLYQMVWVLQNYDFYFFMRVDDDCFLCLDRFISEMPLQPIPLYHWGWVHCTDSVVRPETSIMLLSRDLVEKFVSQNPASLYCNNYGDQTIGIWADTLQLQSIFNHDPRIINNLANIGNTWIESGHMICKIHMAIRGIEPLKQYVLWRHRGELSNSSSLLGWHTDTCRLPQQMDWTQFSEEWRSQPKLCIDTQGNAN